MKTPARLAAAGAVAVAAATAFTGTASAASTPSSSEGGAVFVQTDAVDGNTIVAYDRDLHQLASYRTGGLGGALTGAVVDHLASQGSLTLDQTHHLLYAVNAGSNTLTVFGVHGDRLTRLQVIASGGTFPVSVTTHGNTVYVLNARDGGSIQGFVRIGSRLVKVSSWHRALGLPVTTGDQEFTHTPGQVAFTPDGSKLVVTTKAATNSINVYGIDRSGGPSARPTVNAEPGAVPFAVAFDRTGHLAVAEAGPNAVATFTIHRNGKLTAVDQAATGQMATCWIAGANGVLYAANAGSGNVSAFRDAHGKLTALGNTATAAGSVDAATSSDGRRLYAQTGAAGTVVSFRINHNGSLTRTGSTTVPNATGGEGLAAS
jgi:6-phosphogluconolactonase (cycloisomerase 2 family)